MRQRSLFVARLSQQLRNDVADVLRMAEFLGRSSLLPPQARAVQHIADRCQRQLADLTNIADFSRIEAGSSELECRPFDLHAALRGPVARNAFAADERGVRLRCYVHRDVPRHVIGDDPRLRQVLASLLENVVEQSPGGDIAVYAALEAELEHSYRIRVTISDAELGPPEPADEGLFEFLGRAADAEVVDAPHTGFGFSIINDLLNLMGGRLGVHGENEQGCAVWFTVELQIPDKNAIDDGLPVPHHPILLVSSDPDRIPKVLIALQRRQYAVELEDDGARLTERIQASPYSLVLLDEQRGNHVATFAAQLASGDVCMLPIVGVPHIGQDDIDETRLLQLVQRWVVPMRR